MTEIAYLTSGRHLSAEERSALSFARRLGASRLSFSSLPDSASSLKRFRVIWWHYDSATTLPPDALSPEHLALFRSYVKSGGSLLLTLLAAQYVSDLGFETSRPNLVTEQRWGEVPWTDDYPDIRGLAGFRGHPVFDGLHGGAYTWTAAKGGLFSAAVYEGNSVPEQGNVVAVERQYIRLNEARKIAVEYRPGKGKILTVGTHFFFSDARRRFRPHLERLASNCLADLSRRRGMRKRTYWAFTSPAPVREDCATVKQKVHRSAGHMPESGLAIVREHASENMFDVGGTRILIMGRERGGLDEIWVHPVRILRDLRVSIIPGGTRRVALSRPKPRITVRPESVTREFALSRGRLSETVIGDPSLPAGTLLYHLHDLPGARITFRGTVDLRMMWPLPAHAAGGLVYGWDGGLNALRVRSRDGSLVSLVGTGKKPERVRLTTGGGSVHFDISCTLKANEDGMAFCFSGSGTGIQDARKAFRKLAHDPAAAGARQAEHFRRLFQRRTMFTCSDPQVNEAYRWALAGTDRFLASTPGVGVSLMAGYGTTARGWNGGQQNSGRPGYAWYFGRDSVWTALAMLAYGDHKAARSVLTFLGRYQDLTGKIPHEVTTSGHVHFDAADATPLYLLLMGRYLRASGDRPFVRAEYERIRKAVRFCLSTDTDGDHLIENTGVGHGWVEGGALFPAHAELYLNACWSAALKEAAYCARETGKPGDATRWGKEATRVRRIIEQEFWNERKAFYDFGMRANGSFERNRTVMPAVFLALTACPQHRAHAVLKQLGSERFTTLWGTRFVEQGSKIYNPAGYHTGSVWPLFTGWASLAAFRQGNPQLGFRLLQYLTPLHRKFSAGYLPEVLHGERCESVGVCAHQAWSESMVLQPILEGLLGMQRDAAAHTLELRPFLPDDWSFMMVERIRVGAQLVDVTLRRTGQGVRCSFRLRHGRKLRLLLAAPSGEKRALVLTAGRSMDVGWER